MQVTVNSTDSVYMERVHAGHSELHRLSLHRVQLEWTLRAAVTHMTCRSVVISQPRLTPITLGVAESTFFSLNKLPRSVILAPITFTPLSNRLLSTLYTLIVLVVLATRCSVVVPLYSYKWWCVLLYRYNITSSFIHFSHCLLKCWRKQLDAGATADPMGVSNENWLPFGAHAEFNQQGKETQCSCHLFPKVSVQMKLRTPSSSIVELPQPMSTDGCGPFANYLSLQVSLHLHLNWSHMPS